MSQEVVPSVSLADQLRRMIDVHAGPAEDRDPSMSALAMALQAVVDLCDPGLGDGAVPMVSPELVLEEVFDELNCGRAR